ncbi:MAG: uroporphyrinogen decarboxylase family protein [Deferrisomatales bacterium]|nr:uroporphyrinogen decarboxylase family protein [Deferrisomatales bacterium]
MLIENWQTLSPEDKYAARMKTWMAGSGLEFATPAAKQHYQQRALWIRDAIELRKPERVPICPFVGTYPARYAGVTMREAMYDYEKLGTAIRKFHADFELDGYLSAATYTPGRVLDLLDYKLYQWPGHGVGEDQGYQTVEAEYMLAEEYDLLLQDPTGYWMQRYLPRVFGALEAWQGLPDLTGILEIPNVGPALAAFGAPAVQQSLQALMDAGRVALEWRQAVAAIDTEIRATHGLPAFRGGFSKAPFDIIGDTLRGTRPMMFDLFRRPAKVLEAVERFVPKAIAMGVRTSTLSGNPMVFMPLHKGVDSFMSTKDFEKFYWPTLEAVILGLIEEGCVPMLFVEGTYNSRLDTLAKARLPEGRTLWIFEGTDMREAKAKIGGWGCIGGNVPGSLLNAATPQDVDRYVTDLLEGTAHNGGFILGTGVSLSEARAENFQAMIQAGRRYGA